ncbi:hypothetical protein PTUN_a0939 [Pseudoalteromonas tunicata]|nr:hypothetical protein PTUN_a0939 [Pseudoalteromonas tunicata]
MEFFQNKLFFTGFYLSELNSYFFGIYVYINISNVFFVI